MANFGKYLKALREKQRMAMRDVEREGGVSNSYLCQIEHGKRPPPHPNVLKKLAPLYHVSVHELMRAAGYLDEEQEQWSEMQQLRWAVYTIQNDPGYASAKLNVEGLTPEVMHFIVQLYEKTTGKKLLSM